MILSILATVAVLAALVVIAAALLLAETVLVYIALGLGVVSVLLLLGVLVQGRVGEDETARERSGTDGLGKSSVPTAVTSSQEAVASMPGEDVGPEHLGRAPASVPEPVRETVASNTSAEEPWSEESEFEVPRWQTPTRSEWPESATESTDPLPEPEPASSVFTEEETPFAHSISEPVHTEGMHEDIVVPTQDSDSEMASVASVTSETEDATVPAEGPSEDDTGEVEEDEAVWTTTFAENDVDTESGVSLNGEVDGEGPEQEEIEAGTDTEIPETELSEIEGTEDSEVELSEIEDAASSSEDEELVENTDTLEDGVDLDDEQEAPDEEDIGADEAVETEDGEPVDDDLPEEGEFPEGDEPSENTEDPDGTASPEEEADPDDGADDPEEKDTDAVEGPEAPEDGVHLESDTVVDHEDDTEVVEDTQNLEEAENDSADGAVIAYAALPEEKRDHEDLDESDGRDETEEADPVR